MEIKFHEDFFKYYYNMANKFYTTNTSALKATTADIRKLNVKSGSLSDKLNKLQNLDLIRFVNGEYGISEKLLKRWLEIEYSQKGVYPYRF
jgi:hypothetical protein